MIYKYLLIISTLFFYNSIQAVPNEIIKKMCSNPLYECIKVKKHNSWSQLFPNLRENELVKKLNRTNDFLYPGMILVVPKNLEKVTLLDISPFSLHKKTHYEKLIFISKKLLAWAAFDKNGKQLNWGPISAGSASCPAPLNCATPNGIFHIQHKKGLHCYSKSFPEMISGEKGGAYMPYCMYFYKGYALHGSENLPGYNASHGCIRLFNKDAQWLNEYFIDLPYKKILGTTVVIGD